MVHLKRLVSCPGFRVKAHCAIELGLSLSVTVTVARTGRAVKVTVARGPGARNDIRGVGWARREAVRVLPGRKTRNPYWVNPGPGPRAGPPTRI